LKTATSSKPKTSGTTQRRLLDPHNDGPARTVNTEDQNEAQGLKIAQIWIKTKMGKPGQHTTGTKAPFFIKIQRKSIQPWRLLLSLPHLIEN
jgi:hypothetical protein